MIDNLSLDFLEEIEKAFEEDSCFYISSNKVKRYSEKDFLQDQIDFENISKNFSDTSTLKSPATSYFNKVCEIQSSTLYSRFPEYASNNQDISDFIESNKKELDNIFKQAVSDYVTYGKALIKFNFNEKKQIFELVNECVTKFDTDRKASYVKYKDTISDAVCQDLPYIDANVETTKIVKNGCLFIKQEEGQILKIKQGMFTLDELNDETNLLVSEPFITKVELLFFQLEQQYFNFLQSQNALKTNALVPQSIKQEAAKHLEDNFITIDYSHQTGNLSPQFNPKELITYVDNSGVIQSLASYKEQLELLKQQILELSNSESLYNPSLDDNPSETRIAAQDRVNRSTTAWQSKQSKVNNYIEYILKKYLSLNLGITQEEIELELDSVSILEQEQKEAKNNAIQGQILALCDKIVQLPSVELVALNKTVIDNLINKSSLPNSFKQSVEELVASVINNLQAMQQDPNAQAAQQKQAQIQDQALQLDLAKKQADIEKTQSETQENIAQINQMQVETSLKPNEMAYKQQEQNQQDLDTAIKLEELETKKQDSFLSKLNPFKRR